MGISWRLFKNSLSVFSIASLILISSINISFAVEAVSVERIEEVLNSIDRISFERSPAFDGFVQSLKPGVDLPFQGVIWITDNRDLDFSWASNGLEDERLRVEVSSKFPIASLTKQFIGVAIVLLEREGVLRADDLLSLHIPNAPRAWRNLKLKELLNHTAGVVDRGSQLIPLATPWTQARIQTAPRMSLEELKSAAFRNSVERPDFGRIRYSNSAYTVLAAVIEAATGERYQDVVRRLIIRPLSLNSTGFLSDEFAPNTVAGIGFSTVLHRSLNPKFAMWAFQGSADMYSTAEDLTKWSQSLISTDFLSFEERSKVFGLQNYYSYGFRIEGGESGHRAVHEGFVPGFKSYLSHDFTNGITILVLANDSSQSISDFGEDLYRLTTTGTGWYLN